MQVPTAAQKTRLRNSLALTLPALIFGFLVAAQWQTQSERSQLAVRYNAPLTEAAQSLQNEQNGLKEQLASLRAELDKIQKSASSQSGAARDLQAQIDRLRDLAGLTPVTGDGVMVLLDDAKGTSATAKDLDKSICHATDLTDILNTAWRGGAEAAAINGERIVGTSSVYCVGSTIMVNGTLMSPPFNFAVVGRQDQLMSAFADPEQLKDIKQRRDVHGLGFRVTRASGVTVPAYRGALNVRYGQGY
ncbi:MAG TPA: DUF881 domain-containing protein [Candidatus Limnocylindria bacterium]|nr:DUF881 domain-containing protein [Candidatus Limnocylindria bacterium]